MATHTNTTGLTQAKIDRMKPGPTRLEVADGRGLYFLLQPSGKRSWAFRYRLDGKMKKLTFSGALSLADVRKEADKARVEVAKGADPQGQKIEARRLKNSRAEDDSFAAVVASYMKRHVERKLSKASQRQVDRLLVRTVAPAWKGKRIGDIQRRDVVALLEGMVDAGKPVDANRAQSWISALMNWAVAQELVAVNPAAKLPKVATETARERALNDAELVGVWRAADEVGGPPGLLVKLLLATGQRRTEVAEMTWSEVDVDKAVWTLPASRSKNGRSHAIPLNALALDALRSAPRFESCDFVVTTAGKGAIGGFTAAKNALDRALPADFAPWTFHDCRRSFATHLAQLGVAPHVIEMLLNHSEGGQSKIARTYNVHRYGAECAHASAMWATHVRQLIDGEPGGNVVPMTKREA